MAISKTHPAERIRDAIAAGQPQAFVAKKVDAIVAAIDVVLPPDDQSLRIHFEHVVAAFGGFGLAAWQDVPLLEIHVATELPA